ncbi:hypothetical protein B0H19DRAFT_1245815 [Mycena capillaripes]|nr:hypothetical protein B0H19DRAFT_1245815 [Mycena capillaripes]
MSMRGEGAPSTCLRRAALYSRSRFKTRRMSTRTRRPPQAPQNRLYRPLAFSAPVSLLASSPTSLALAQVGCLERGGNTAGFLDVCHGEGCVPSEPLGRVETRYGCHLDIR